MSRYIKGKPDFADCEKCSRTYGTLGCCSTVSNEWVYSCLEGMLEKAYANGIKSVEPKRGEWIDKGKNLWKCSNCEMVIYSESEQDRNEFHKWCSRCGSRMKGVDDINRPRGTYTSSKDNVEWYATEATCNLCGKPWMGARNFCPNCGADMREREGE